MSKKGKAELVLLLMTLIWGSTFVVGKIGLAEIPVLQFVAIRFTIAVVILFVVARKHIVPLDRNALTKGTVLGLLLFLGFVTQTIGLTLTTASKSAFITGMMVIFVPLLQFIIEKRAPRPGNLLGVAVVSLGLWFLTSPTGSTFNVGDALTIVCALVFAIYIVYLDVIANELTPEQLSFTQMAVNAVLAWAGALIFEEIHMSYTITSWGILVYLALFATLVTTYMQTRYQKDTTPTRAVIIFTIEPVFAAVTAYLFLGERIGPLGVVGGALIIGGVLISEFAESIPFLRGMSKEAAE